MGKDYEGQDTFVFFTPILVVHVITIKLSISKFLIQLEDLNKKHFDKSEILLSL